MKKITLALAIILSFAIQANAQVNPCLNTSRLQSVIIQAGGGSSAQFITNAATDQGILVCNIAITVRGDGTGNTFQFTYGTGSTCATGNVTLTGTMRSEFTASTSGTVALNMPMPFVKLPAANNLCMTTVGTLFISGVISYVVF